MHNPFVRKITKDQSRDTGMGLVLLLLLAYFTRKKEWLLIGAGTLHVINMTIPKVYRPLAIVWFGLSDVLGAVVSKVLMSVIFFGVVTPMAVFRRLSGKDGLKLKLFKIGQGSVLLERNHLFTAKDLERPY